MTSIEKLTLNSWLKPDSLGMAHAIIERLEQYSQFETYSDPGGAFALQRVRRKINKFGFDWMHMLFEPDKTAHPSRVIATELFCRRFDFNQLELTRKYVLPKGYREFLRFSNGAYFFGGHLQLDGHETMLSDLSSSAAYEVCSLQYSNFAHRTPSLPNDMVEIGHYPYSATTLAARGECIVASQHFGRDKEKVWDNFQVFFESEFDRLKKLSSIDGVIDEPELVCPLKS